MTDDAALRLAVLENPADDTPRLVYADYCDDRGESAVAELIRTQIEAYRDPKQSYLGIVSPIESPATSLHLNRLGRKDVGRPNRKGEVRISFPGWKVVVSRGFLSTAGAGLNALIEAAPLLFGRHPITKVRVSNVNLDFHPEVAGFAGRVGWRYRPAYGGQGVLPEDIYLELSGSAGKPVIPFVATYGTVQACLADLGKAVVRWGRKLVGLRPDYKREGSRESELL